MKNTIKNIIMTITVVASATYSLNASSFAVTDPGSYSYYIEQLKAAGKELTEMKKSVDQATNLNTSFDGYMDDLRQQFDFTNKIKNALNTELNQYSDYKRNLSKAAKRLLDSSKLLDPKNIRELVNLNLDGVFLSPDNAKFYSAKIKNLRNYERQKMLKEGIIKTEEKLVGLNGSFDRIVELRDRVTKSGSTKESMDLNNTISLEILNGINTLIDLMATLGQAEMSAKYINYNKAKHEKEMATNPPQKIRSIRNGVPMTDKEHKQHTYDCVDYRKKYGHNDTVISGVDCPGRFSSKLKEFYKLYGRE